MQQLTLYKREAKGDDASAEWAVKELPGVILWKDSDPWESIYNSETISWSWQFEVMDLDLVEKWPQGHGRIWPVHELKNQQHFEATSQLMQPVLDQVFPTRREALQALEVLLHLAETSKED